ncbi:transketolase family protein [Actinoallomurus bryophytorum]|uniref:Transketolase n=1 Tax=Actinoallomurus bryophytorum TaxID=1490222 RepID=A0A543CTW8_9ACTN|nr:transketolase C-terminal domain-containing protein [Actinoallomurus bryophytorum]TQM00547.1 transketolase [Actinoallomurus bryophytorum]
MRTSTRDAFGQALVELGKERPDFVVLDAAVSEPTRTWSFAQRFPDRYFNCGIAEQSLVSIAAGLAASGVPAVAVSFAAFLTTRAFDQMRLLVAQPRLNVTLVGTHGGITVGEDGISAQAVEDLALMCSLPGVGVVVPADAPQTAAALRAALESEGPFYLRCSRYESAADVSGSEPFATGTANVLRPGHDITVVATGTMVEAALEAADVLAGDGIACRVVNVSTLQPIDARTLESAARETGRIVVAEEHLKQGGLASIVARTLATLCPVPMRFVGLEGYTQSAPAAELLAAYGLTADAIVRSARELLH